MVGVKLRTREVVGSLSLENIQSSTGKGLGQQDIEFGPALSSRLDQMKSRDHFQSQLFDGPVESQGWRVGVLLFLYNSVF